MPEWAVRNSSFIFDFAKWGVVLLQAFVFIFYLGYRDAEIEGKLSRISADVERLANSQREILQHLRPFQNAPNYPSHSPLSLP